MRLITLDDQTDFAGWRQAARRLVVDGVAPEDVSWSVGASDSLFDDDASAAREPTAVEASARFTVPRGFLDRCATAILHRDADRFAFLYRLLWRLRREPGLAEIAVDADMVRLDAMVKAVHRDLHKMKAYVRFREVAVAAGVRGRPSQVERAMRDGDLAAADAVVRRVVRAGALHRRGGRAVLHAALHRDALGDPDARRAACRGTARR